MANEGSAALGELVPAELSELLRTQQLALRRPVWGRRHGRHQSARAGVGLDFRDHRAYVPGDDPRQLDWRAVARRDRLVLRQTEAEDELPVVLAVDVGANMGYGEGPRRKLGVARAFAGALTWAAIRQGDSVGLVLAGDDEIDASLLRPGSGHDRLEAIARKLVAAPAKGRAPMRELLPMVAPRLRRRSLFVLISDLLDFATQVDDAHEVEQELLRGLAQLRAKNHDVVVLQVLHQDELEFPWSDSRLVRFVDRRGLREQVEGTGAGLRQRYLARIGAHLRWLDETCEAHGILIERISTARALAPAFMGLLARLAGDVEAMAAVPR
ncbi:MAG TPA: DUF58 domain-containing protein [Nannocystaceae bacterium]|nr:DUF58 domain-containing protein [Nannocystaceae bacterium]